MKSTIIENIYIFMILVSALKSHNKLVSNALPFVQSHHQLGSSSANYNMIGSNRLESPRLSVVEWDQYNERNVQGPDTYAFGYDVQDPETDNIHFRHEERLPNGTVVGSYGFVTPDGDAHVVRYIADHLGYRASVETTKRFADVKPIPVNVEQDLADEISSAQMALELEQEKEKHYGNVPVAVFDYKKGKYATKSTGQRKSNISLNNKIEDTYQVIGNLAQRRHSFDRSHPVLESAASVPKPSGVLNPPSDAFSEAYPFY